jgi:hypothetical protein
MKTKASDLKHRFKNNLYKFKMSYNTIENRFRNANYNKLSDYDYNYYAHFITNFNLCEYKDFGDVIIRIERRNIINEMIFYVVKLQIKSNEKIFQEKLSFTSDFTERLLFKMNLKTQVDTFTNIKKVTSQSILAHKEEIVIESKVSVITNTLLPNINTSFIKNILYSLLYLLILAVSIYIYFYRLDNFEIAEYLQKSQLITYQLYVYINYLSYFSIYNNVNNDAAGILEEYPYIYQSYVINLTENY